MLKAKQRIQRKDSEQQRAFGVRVYSLRKEAGH